MSFSFTSFEVKLHANREERDVPGVEAPSSPLVDCDAPILFARYSGTQVWSRMFTVMMKVGLVVVFLELEQRSFPCQNSQSIHLTECRFIIILLI
jgi:hypothetical protein